LELNMRTLLNWGSGDGYAKIPVPSYLQLDVSLRTNSLKYKEHSKSLSRFSGTENRILRIVNSISDPDTLKTIMRSPLEFNIYGYKLMGSVGIHSAWGVGNDGSADIIPDSTTDIIMAYWGDEIKDINDKSPLKFIKHSYRFVSPVEIEDIPATEIPDTPTIISLDIWLLIKRYYAWAIGEKDRAKRDINYIPQNNKQFVRGLLDESMDSFLAVSFTNLYLDAIEGRKIVFDSLPTDIHYTNVHELTRIHLSDWRETILKSKMTFAEIAHNIALPMVTALEFYKLGSISQTRNLNWLINYCRVDYFNLLLAVTKEQGSGSKNMADVATIIRELKVLQSDKTINRAVTPPDYQLISRAIKEGVVKYL